MLNIGSAPSVTIEETELTEVEKKQIDDILAEMAVSASCDVCFCVFKTEPYIDAACIVRSDKSVTRLIFADGYAWTYEKERFFENIMRRVSEKKITLSYDFATFDKLFRYYSGQHPEWKLRRYHIYPLKLLDHIYNCMKRNSAKEMLYKAELDELAMGIDEIDELNLLASRPSDLYDGISIKCLRALNCHDGARLLSTHEHRLFLIKLQSCFPEIFKARFNDAQARYLEKLIDGDLTVGEAGRLFTARRKDLELIWCPSQYELFLKNENSRDSANQTLKALNAIDPVYGKHLPKVIGPGGRVDGRIATLKLYLLAQRDEYNRKIRVSNRRREYDWQERNMGYVVRYPQTINDFCREAIYMDNCLLTYLEAYINNDTTIMFIRKEDDVNKPFITLEIYGNTLMQAYHRFNTDCLETEAEWIREFCDRHGISRGGFLFDRDRDLLF